QRHPVVRELNIHAAWSANEKTAYEAALGMSYCGKRAMVCMKHVGLNVAADPFINSAITGAGGGLILAVADDPSMHSSQNEQDSRFYGKFALIPVLEPSNQQEAYDMAYEGFNLSEKYGLPVMIRITTRLSHSRSVVTIKTRQPENDLHIPDDRKQFVLLPSVARKRYHQLLDVQPALVTASELSPYNSLHLKEQASLGIIACGLANNYLRESFPDGVPYSVLKIGQYPVPVKLIRQLAAKSERILVLEEGYPLLEELLLGITDTEHPRILGRLDGTLPRDGELNPDLVARALQIESHEGPPVPGFLANRPPMLCPGCGHADMFKALLTAIKPYSTGRSFSDIGCYTLGALPPFNAINSCVDMGASITMAKGAADAGLIPAVAVIGDSTFTHSGMTGLLDAVNERSPITVIISDNETTGMTGGQHSSATGHLEKICLGIGVEPEHLHVIIPLRKNHKQNAELISRELKYPGVSVVISRRECIQTAARRKRVKKVTVS
ncbi:MAG: indolepyruvate ferredoxin oxidoreductase, partial [Bacteroidales bacterium]|nr:indolepyruvate ferredoxin oxidoreductase [Bacteroidales bacterium]